MNAAYFAEFVALRDHRRLRSSALVVGLVLLALPVRAEPKSMRAELACRPEAAPGRVLCELKYTTPGDARLVWADALVTSTPDFVRPLRSRLAPERFGAAGATERKLTFALLAAQNGVGEVTVRARAVVCRGQGSSERCRPETHEARAEVRVGS